jgi:hypothetical protein
MLQANLVGRFARGVVALQLLGTRAHQDCAQPGQLLKALVEDGYSVKVMASID